MSKLTPEQEKNVQIKQKLNRLPFFMDFTQMLSSIVFSILLGLLGKEELFPNRQMGSSSVSFILRDYDVPHVFFVTKNNIVPAVNGNVRGVPLGVATITDRRTINYVIE